jgi:hypothetical protein
MTFLSSDYFGGNKGKREDGMFNPLDLSNVDDLGVLLEAFRALGQQGNRVGLDLFCMVEREALARHQTTEIASYSDSDLAGALAMLTLAVDGLRESGFQDDYPAVQWMLCVITVLCGEMESRGGIQPVQ